MPRLARHLLHRDDFLGTHGRQDSHQQILAFVKVSLHLLVDLVGVHVEEQVRAGVVLVIHDGDKALLIDIDELEILAGHNRGRHVVRRRRNILELLSGEDVNGHDIGLGVTVLACLRRRIVDDLAGKTLDHDVRALLQGTCDMSVRRNRNARVVRRDNDESRARCEMSKNVPAWTGMQSEAPEEPPS